MINSYLRVSSMPTLYARKFMDVNPLVNAFIVYFGLLNLITCWKLHA